MIMELRSWSGCSRPDSDEKLDRLDDIGTGVAGSGIGMGKRLAILQQPLGHLTQGIAE
jgi:hypothetical protein